MICKPCQSKLSEAWNHDSITINLLDLTTVFQGTCDYCGRHGVVQDIKVDKQVPVERQQELLGGLTLVEACAIK